jgi:pilus assembly protein CpaF
MEVKYLEASRMNTPNHYESLRKRIRLEADWSTFNEDKLREFVNRHAALLSEYERDETLRLLAAEFMGYGAIDSLINDESVTEIMVNGPECIWVEVSGTLRRAQINLSEAALRAIIERIVLPLGLRIDNASPVVDARLPNGSRVHAILPPLAIDGPYLTIRKFGAKNLPLNAFCSNEVATFIDHLIRSRYNILISGATSTGKTTFLNAAAQSIPHAQRIITVEDAAELRLAHPHVVRLEARRANAEGLGEFTIRDLVRNALRMRPDRIIVGEFRGAEAFDMLQAMNTGHDGSLSTCHANSSTDALRRVETMSLIAGSDLPLYGLREQILSSVDLVIQLRRDASGHREVREIAEVIDVSEQGWVTNQVASCEDVIGSIQRPPRDLLIDKAA